MPQKDRYLVTGGSGFLGRILTRYLKQTGNEVFLLGRSAENDLTFDISTEFDLRADLKFDIVIHAAGKAHSVPRTAHESDEFFDVNFKGTKNLCHALEKLTDKPAAFIFISTVAVYGLDEGIGISESHALNGQTPYAKSKIMAEEWLQGWASESNIKLGILRLPLIAGPNPPGNLSAMIDGIRMGRYFSIGDANAKKSIVWAEDVAGVIPTAAARGGIFNLTDGHHPSFGELEKIIAHALGKKDPMKIPPALAKFMGKTGDILGKASPINTNKLKKITSTLTFDDSKARQLLNWNPSPVLEKLPGTL
ncbi:MAG: NAD-dependent epimerase/dehydratase family protein [Bacteroidetes bacterium]|nr:NAD-dependent epimerase/dehydratase family protein [Bacteroidota bacterium]